MLTRALAAGLLLLLATAAYATAQEPTPEPTPQYPRCIAGFGSFTEGERFAGGNGTRFTVPEDATIQLLMTPPGTQRIYLCHVESNSTITVSYECEEIARNVDAPMGGPVLDELMASCMPASELDCSGAMHGGVNVTAVSGIRVTLPPEGQYGLRIPPPHGDNFFTVCHVGTGSSVSISISPPCQEIKRSQPEPAAEAILDAIVDSCRVPPPPTPTPCTGDVAGAQTLTFGAVTITLPKGSYGVRLFPVDDYVLSVTVCTTMDGSSVRLSGFDCHETYREQRTTASVSVLDDIAASCVVTGTPPEGGIAPPATTTPSSSGAIRPPDTGDAGLCNKETR